MTRGGITSSVIRGWYPARWVDRAQRSPGRPGPRAGERAVDCRNGSTPSGWIPPAAEVDARVPTTPDAFHGLPPGGDPVPGRSGRQQRSSLVPAAQGRLRTPAQATAGGAVRRPRRAIRGARNPPDSGPCRSPFRIYRDVRFSKDKSPYKTNLGASFPWTGGGDGSPAGYFHLEPGEIFIGGGMWHPEPAQLNAFRRLLETDPGRVHAVIDEPAFVATFGELMGNRLTRLPKGFYGRPSPGGVAQAQGPRVQPAPV